MNAERRPAPQMPNQRIDGQLFAAMIVGGAAAVGNQRLEIDRINVFPVADGDTGTNMALSLQAIAARLEELQETSLGDVAAAAADAGVIGAKGNSGIILAHWFQGLASAIGDRDTLSGDQLAPCLSAATRHVYAAVTEPVEGTILTVMRRVSDESETFGPGITRSLSDVFERLLRAARESLSLTTSRLEALQAAGVVDAGGKGFLCFLEGALAAVRGESVQKSLVVRSRPDVREMHAHSERMSRERFCIEIVVRGRKLVRSGLRDLFSPHGTSLVIASTETAIKVHIHTNHPQEILQLATRLGTLAESKVDDMWRQQRSNVSAEVEAGSEQPGSVAIITDSTSDLPKHFHSEYAIYTVPLQVMFGDDVYRDQVDLSTEDFYDLLRSSDHHPRTSQPSPGAFVMALDRISHERDAVIITVSGALSGTYRSAKSGARLSGDRNVVVYDSQSLSLGFGMIVANAARLARSGATLDEIVYWLDRWRSDTEFLFTVETLEYLRRGGRIGRVQSAMGSLLDVRPIFSLSEGNIVVNRKARGRQRCFDRIAHAAESCLRGVRSARIGLVSIGECDELDRLQDRLASSFELVETIRAAPTGVVGAHAGPGAWGVALQRVREDDPLCH